MAIIKISDEVYKELEDNLGDQDLETFASLMIRSGVHQWKELVESLPDEF